MSDMDSGTQSAPKLTDEIILEAISRLHHRLGKVELITTRNLRVELGRGSYSRIGPVLRRWQEEQLAQAEPDSTIPSQVHKSANELLHEIWKAAQSNAALHLAKDRALVTEWLRDRGEAQAAVELENAHLSGQLEAMTSTAQQNLQEKVLLESRLQELAGQLAASSREALVNQERVDQLTEQLRQLQSRHDKKSELFRELSAELTRTTTLLNESKAQQAATAEKLTDKESELVELHDVIGARLHDLQQAQKTIEQQTSQIERLTGELETQKGALVASQHECISMSSQLQSLKKVEQQNQEQTVQIDTLQEKLVTGQLATQQLKNENANAQSELANLKNENAELRRQNQVAADKEKALLIQVAGLDARKQTLEQILMMKQEATGDAK